MYIHKIDKLYRSIKQVIVLITQLFVLIGNQIRSIWLSSQDYYYMYQQARQNEEDSDGIIKNKQSLLNPYSIIKESRTNIHSF